MDDLEEKDLLKNGFESVLEKRWDNQQKNYNMVRSGPFIHKGFEPEPTIQLRTAQQSTASIGSLHFKLPGKAEFERFITKTIPTYCELK